MTMNSGIVTRPVDPWCCAVATDKSLIYRKKRSYIDTLGIPEFDPIVVGFGERAIWSHPTLRPEFFHGVGHVAPSESLRP